MQPTREWLKRVLSPLGFDEQAFAQMNDADMIAELPTGWCATDGHPAAAHTRRPSCILFAVQN
jgi:hypothetical protein